MNRIKVALGDVHSTMLRDILAEITNSQRDMELLGAESQSQLQQVISENKPDVVICDIRREEFPHVCGELFTQPDPPVVVGLARDGRDASVCIPNAGAVQLMSVIRSATSETDESKVVELSRPPDADRDTESSDPYTSNAECLDDLLRCLDLALLAELETFEATVWEEGTQRLQGLAISPDEVRSLLQKTPAAATQRTTAELRRRRARLQEWTAKRISASTAESLRLPFVHLIEQFGLRPFEQFCLAVALAPELDRNKYGKAYALLQDDVTRKQPSFELFLRLWAGVDDPNHSEVRGAFDTSRPLRRWNLLRFSARDATEPSAMFGRRVELDERIARYLLGVADLGPQLSEIAVIGGWDSSVLEIAPDPRIRDRIETFLAGTVAASSATHVVIHVHGPYGTGRRSLIAGLCGRQGLGLIRVDAARLVALPTTALDETLSLLAREPLLEPTAVCLENVDPVLDGDNTHTTAIATFVETVRRTAPIVFVLSHLPWLSETIVRGGAAHSVGLELPRAAAARRLWATELAHDALDPATGGVESIARELGGRFALSPGQIRDAATAARLRARLEGQPSLLMADLYRGCRDQCSHRLTSLARHVTTNFGWSDLILPLTQANQLRELETAIRNASGVLEDWDFVSRLPYGRGITALFSGPSGTGKTMAAGILARELGLDLYQIDLSRVVSKYIGQTEKNLDRIFEEAQASNAMLFFDEADALFGKRSAIKDAHDRYANIEVSYLLQKMEVREGVTILATNLRANLDEAFLRRIRFVVEFPTPEQHQRLQIWRGSLPGQARLAANVDLAMLAKRYRLTGGSIVNICLSAASLAYAPGGAIEMRHLLHATKRELQKLGEQYREEDFSPELTVVVGGRGRNGA